jgi:hypothetical protein
VDLLGANRETAEAVLLLLGAALAAVAALWLLVVAFRVARLLGPLSLALIGVLIAAAPFAIHALDGPVGDLGPAVRFLDSDLHLRLDPPGASGLPRQVQMQSLVAVVGAVLVGLALLWLMGRALSHWRRVFIPVMLLLLALVCLATPFVVNRLIPPSIDLKERDKIVDGDRHLTLTGWNRSDYAAALRTRPDVVVLQMANSDVTDAVLEDVKPLTKLRHLDLADTAVTDAGLAALDGLPLESLRLNNTAITDAGFRDHVAPIATLKNINLIGTSVSPEAVADWKKAKPGRKALTR